MNTRWIIFLFALWTLFLWLAAPLLLSITTKRTSDTSVFIPGIGMCSLQIVEAHPILDWSSRMSARTLIVSKFRTNQGIWKEGGVEWDTIVRDKLVIFSPKLDPSK